MARDGLGVVPGRFSEPALLILVSLSDGPKHGYAMVEDIESFTGARLGPARCTAPSPAWSAWG